MNSKILWSVFTSGVRVTVEEDGEYFTVRYNRTFYYRHKSFKQAKYIAKALYQEIEGGYAVLESALFDR